MAALAGLRLLGSRFLAHRATGWACLVLFAVVAGGVIKYKNMKIALDACLANKPTAATEDFANELKDQNLEKLKEALASLDAADHPCLEWVWKPGIETGATPLRDSPEGE